MVRQLKSAQDQNAQTDAVTRLDEKVDQHGADLHSTLDSIQGIKGQIDNLVQRDPTSDQHTPASQAQVDGVEKKVDVLSTGLSDLSGLLQSLV